MTVKARFYVSQFTKIATMSHVQVTLLPVTRKDDVDNIDWSKFTPSGKLDLNVSTATGAAAWFEEHLGQDVAITFEAIPTD